MQTGSKQNMQAVNNEQIDPARYIEQPWDVIKSYFQDAHLERLVRHQLESYNDFVTSIPKTIAMFNPVHIRSENLCMNLAENIALKCL